MEFKTIEKSGEGLISQKKSRFIGKAFYVESHKVAEEIIEKIRKEYYDARHNCYAYRILEEEGIIERQSDDGEPARNSRKPNT